MPFRGRDATPTSTISPSQADDVLRAWSALEVLAPTTFSRPGDLAREGTVITLGDDALPWEDPQSLPRPGRAVYFHLILGTIPMGPAVARMLAQFPNAQLDRLPTDHAIAASVVLDQDGRPLERFAVSVSSFAWALPRVLAGDIERVAEWSSAKDRLIADLEAGLCPGGATVPLTRETIRNALEHLVAVTGLPPELVIPARFVVRRDVATEDGTPSPLVLNTFYLEDLEQARTLIRTGHAPGNLRRYLGLDQPNSTTDLLADDEALEAAVAPVRLPPGSWPAPGGFSLNLLQQAAVNLGMDELREAGLLAINGPPGTGKTTLLREMYAAIVTNRAQQLVGFDDPAAAFTRSGQQLGHRSGSYQDLYRLDPRIKGFEMVVASSNNRAVENVSAALPAREATASTASNLNYFRLTSDTLLTRETWGLGGAVLGNSKNRSRFSDIFWWHKDVGMKALLGAAEGNLATVTETDTATGDEVVRPAAIVTSEQPPRTPIEARRQWRAAQTRFREALARSNDGLRRLEDVRALVATVAHLVAEQERLGTALHELTAATDDAARSVAEAGGAAKVARTRLAEHDAALRALRARAPRILDRVFRTGTGRAWHTERRPIRRAVSDGTVVLATADRLVDTLTAELHALNTRREVADLDTRTASEHLGEAHQKLEDVRGDVGGGLIDDQFFAMDHAATHTAVAWLDQDVQRLREEVFVAAIDLHRVFILAAAKPLRHNIGAVMSLINGRVPETGEQEAIVPDLWSSLFLVVPLISTTFASVRRMLGILPPESIGWLFVDEAGQATPQSAIGALVRARRAIIVGDPLQIEPVVALPVSLTQAICDHFNVDDATFNAPVASCQSLADRASAYATRIDTADGMRTIGLPLLVHRRCSEPMFEIANEIAYGGLMVQAKVPRPSTIGDVLGPSAWFDVAGTGDDKWCPAEAAKVVEILRALKDGGAPPDLYVVTPFRIVASRLSDAVAEDAALNRWLRRGSDGPLPIGTVHTVQGREAEAIILILGAPGTAQHGARSWAGGRPNLLNVAVTRAKERLYVVGNRTLWREAGHFQVLDELIDSSTSASLNAARD